MKKIIYILIISILFASSINKEIRKTNYYISKMNKKLDSLAIEIHKKEKFLSQINAKILNLNNQIKSLEKELKNSNKNLSFLQDLKKGYEQKSKTIQNEITNFISENYFNNSLQTENINDLIKKEISKKILDKYSQKIEKLIKQNTIISSQIKDINNKINYIIQKQKDLKNKKQELIRLLNKQKKELANLNNKKIKYKQKLQSLIKKQKQLQEKLVKLKVIKKRKPIQNLYFKPQIATYHGAKTIAPIKGKIIKKFGSYIDPIYKIKVYNDSITIKPYKKNSVVRSILSGKVVYIGENNDKKIIVIKHKNNLFSIYANLDKISPLLKKGSYVKRGQIIARVKDSLEFEVTYKEKPINPTKVISIK